jgi:hypothetical protein
MRWKKVKSKMLPLKLKALSTYTCLAKGAIFTAAAMRCGYDGFEETSFTQPNSAEMQLGAKIEGKESLLVPQLQLWNAYQTPNNKANLM